MLMLGGCMVGPNYSKPAVPLSPAFKESPPAAFKEGDGWKTATPSDQVLRGDWWTMFQDRSSTRSKRRSIRRIKL